MEEQGTAIAAKERERLDANALHPTTSVEGLQEWLDLANRGALTTEAALESAIQIYKAAKGEIERYREIQNQAKSLIGEIFAETGQASADTPAGKAYVTRPSVSVRYDWKALDSLAASDDGLRRILEPHRKETMRTGTLTIR